MCSGGASAVRSGPGNAPVVTCVGALPTQGLVETRSHQWEWGVASRSLGRERGSTFNTHGDHESESQAKRSVRNVTSTAFLAFLLRFCDNDS